ALDEETRLAGHRAAILEEARVEAEAKINEGYAAGLRRGEEEARRAFEASVGEAVNALRETAAQAASVREQFMDTLAPQLSALARQAATKILQRETQTDGELVLRTVRAALQHLLDEERVSVRVNPNELNVLKAHRPNLIDEMDGMQIDLHGDETIAPGGCVAETDTLHIDGRLEEQLARLFDALLD
ncbi:MAG: FliH/SctL family protein, partial [Candidatus Hydrogenedentales bacterium]